MLRFAQKSWAWRNRKQNRLEAPYCLCGVICSLLTRTFFSSIWLQARYICVLLETKFCCTSVDGLGCEGPTVLGVPWRNVVLRNVECLQCLFFPLLFCSAKAYASRTDLLRLPVSEQSVHWEKPWQFLLFTPPWPCVPLCVANVSCN